MKKDKEEPSMEIEKNEDRVEQMIGSKQKAGSLFFGNKYKKSLENTIIEKFDLDKITEILGQEKFNELLKWFSSDKKNIPDEIKDVVEELRKKLNIDIKEQEE